MPHFEPAHAGEREIDECSGRHGDQRLVGELRNRPRERGGALLGQSTQHVALGDDGGVARTQPCAGT
ncbi:MAG TPA: hypothetical protein VLN59_07965, partial [Burkholderiales bacterium]|nr:hypothetical protein [Burkholderiales bacterium]